MERLMWRRSTAPHAEPPTPLDLTSWRLRARPSARPSTRPLCPAV
jgi:hypothetical protein